MNHSLPWIILFSPLVSALLILSGLRSRRYLSAYLSIAAVAVSFVASCLLLGTENHNPHFPWIDLSPGLLINFGVAVTDLSKVMLLVVTSVGLLVHVYSLGYMHEDRDMARYFAGLSLFMFSMLGIVLADNFVMMFIFWELVGVSSYLLIGHWYERPQAADAANKAFLVNRIGDFGFMAGILMLWSVTGQIDFTQLKTTINLSVQEPAFQSHFVPYLTVATLLIFCGPMGKSAQVPLHVWLPDAMEGPTPVSALIHAATMVAAGVYLLVRISFLLAFVPVAQEVIAIVGITTAVLAALMATQQNDIKRILAYSTLSQLGYMVCAAGVAAGGAAMFHLFTHAFFKALLFLGAGAVIHALHHEQDIWKMGGLRQRMPVTFWTFLLATLALMGCPFLSGFYSKDAIIEAMFKAYPIIGWLGLFVAFLTAFYMTRLFVVVFVNRASSKAIEHAHEVPAVMAWPLAILAVPAVTAGYLAYPRIGEAFGPLGRVFGISAAEVAGAAHPEVGGLVAHVTLFAVGAFVVGALLGFVLYRGKTRDPIHVGLLRHKFYFDELYAALIRVTQDALASASAFFDRWVIDGLGVRGISGATWGAGFILRFAQVGNLQAYAFLFGIGLLAIILIAIWT